MSGLHSLKATIDSSAKDLKRPLNRIYQNGTVGSVNIEEEKEIDEKTYKDFIDGEKKNVVSTKKIDF